ncbi:MAG: hypothetical protein WC668_00835 [Patescibacteria group bacterium]|jgi:hypothetical protein
MDNSFITNNPLQVFLGRVVIDQSYIYIDYWSMIHFCSGAILGLLFAIYCPKRYSWLFTLAFLLVYEIIEIFLTGILFITETAVDRIWDLIIGMIGFFIFYYFFHKKS